MRSSSAIVALVTIVAFAASACAPRLARHDPAVVPERHAHRSGAQPAPELWRDVARKLPPAQRVVVELLDGTRIEGVVLTADEEAVTIRKRTRLPEPPIRVAYGSVSALELDSGRGIGPGKAIAIGVATGAATFLTMMFIAFTLIED